MGYMPGKRHMSDSIAIVNNETLKQVLEYRLQGMTLKETAARCGISVPKAVRLIARHLEDHPAKQIAEYRSAELEKYDTVEKQLVKKITKAYVKITTRPVVKLDEHGEPVMETNQLTGALQAVLVDRVADDGPQNEAIALLIKLWDRRAKLLGLDRPTAKVPDGPPPIQSTPEEDVALMRKAVQQLGLTRMTRMTTPVEDAVVTVDPIMSTDDV